MQTPEEHTYTDNLISHLNYIFGLDYHRIVESNFSAGGYENIKTARKLKHVIEIDPTGVLLTGVVRNLIAERLSSTKFSLSDLEQNFETFESIISRLSSLRKLVSTGDIPKKLEQQENYIRETVQAHIDRELNEEELSDLLLQAPEITTEADKYIKVLRAMSFTDGYSSEQDLAPTKFNDQIVATRHVSDIYEIAHRLPLGISLVAILCNQEHESHFVFVSKSGGKSIVFTPNPVNTDPNGMLNCARQEIRALCIDLLPHELFKEIEYARPFFNEKPQDMPHEVKVIGKVSELPFIKAFTAILLFQQVSDLWNSSYDAPMAYTGDRLLPSKGVESLMPTLYQEHALTLNPESVTNVSQDEFLSLCEAASLDVTKEIGRNSYIEANFGPVLDGMELLGPKKLTLDYLGRTLSIELESFPKHYIGTQAEMQADVAQLARANKTKALKEVVSTYYEAHDSEIKSWIKEKALESNFLLECIAKNTLELPKPTSEQIEYILCNKLYKSRSSIQLSGSRYISRKYRASGWREAFKEPIRLHDVTRSGQKKIAVCPVTGGKADLYMVVTMNDAIDVSSVTGVNISELPYHLGIMGFEYTSANSNLNRVDPLANARFAPHLLNYSIELAVSIKGLNILREKYGLEKVTKKSLIESSEIFGK